MACFISQLLYLRISGIQQRQRISHQLMCSLCPSHSWLFFGAHVHRRRVCWPWFLLSETGQNRRQCPNGGITLLSFESKERHFVICLLGMLVFSPGLKKKKNDQKPLVINTYCPLFNSIQHSRKAVSLCQITWRSLCVELTDEVHWWWIHLNAQESTLGHWGSARKLTRVGLEGLWTKKVQIVKYHALRLSLWCNGYQDVIATILKQMCLVFILLQACYRSKLQKRELAQYSRNQGEKNCLISSGCYLLVGLSFSRVWVVEMRIQKIASSSAK